MSEPIIRVNDLTIGWDQMVLQRHASFTVEHSEVFVILGGSGSGKSTLLRYLIGLEAPSAGEIVVQGTNPTFHTLGPPSFGVMFQSGALLGSYTVGENVALPLGEWTDLPRGAIDAIVQAKLRLVGLEQTESMLPAELSGGMRKRAAIARAMALEPRLLFLDEPSAGLDPITAAELDELILALNRELGLTVVVVTHDLDSIERIGHRCIMLDRTTQSIIARGNPRELRKTSDDERVRAFFQRRPQEPTGPTT
jgi:phospholipid/cholesterol/gamma-HCH transport system ATP-binding protein